MIRKDDEQFRQMVESVARELVTVEFHPGGSFLRTPLLYPGGSTVVVGIDHGPGAYLVSDLGLGHQEAETMGATAIYQRHAPAIAEAAGVKFEHASFFILQVTRDQLPGAVATIANCSQEAVAVAAYKLAERRATEYAQGMYDRLVSLFTKDKVTRDAEFVGASNTKWHVAALVRANRKPAVFEAVMNHHTSIAAASTKFHDIAALEKPPIRVAMVRSKKSLGTYLAVLHQAANVVEDNVSDETIVKLAKAA